MFALPVELPKTIKKLVISGLWLFASYASGTEDWSVSEFIPGKDGEEGFILVTTTNKTTLYSKDTLLAHLLVDPETTVYNKKLYPMVSQEPLAVYISGDLPRRVKVLNFPAFQLDIIVEHGAEGGFAIKSEINVEEGGWIYELSADGMTLTVKNAAGQTLATIDGDYPADDDTVYFDFSKLEENVQTDIRRGGRHHRDDRDDPPGGGMGIAAH